MNKYAPHVLVLPEDDANRQIANGFGLEIGGLRQFQILGPAGGWHKVLELFRSVHIAEMERCASRTMVLLVDFDESSGRLGQLKEVIPSHLSDRVFVLGVWTEPEDLPQGLKETGESLATDCREGTSTTWDHELLKHNAAEVDRLRQIVRPFLF
jgi:hypothetical protein